MDMRKAWVAAAIAAVAFASVYAAYAWNGHGNGGDQNAPDTGWFDESKIYFEISSERQLAGLACLVNKGTSFENKVIALSSDIELQSPWTPIGLGRYDGASHSVYGAAFDGVFDGNEHSISGLRISASEDFGGDSAGLFGVVAGGTVRNLALIDVQIESLSSDSAGGIAGALCGDGTISECNVGQMDDGSAVKSNSCTGGIVGRIAGKASVSDCTNFACVSSPDGQGCGGIAGKASFQTDYEDIQILYCYNVGRILGCGCAGGILGNGSIWMEGCMNIGDVSSTSGGNAGGIIGKAVNTAMVQYCNNHGDVTSTGSDRDATGVGGIVGTIRYDGDLQEFPQGPGAMVTICVNLGNISASGSDAGGIVGTVYNCAHIMCYNLAGKISAASHAAGIVGSFLTTETPVPSGIKICNLSLADNVSTTSDIAASDSDLFICPNGNPVGGNASSQDLPPGFVVPEVIVVKSPEDIPKIVSSEGYAATLVIPQRIAVEDMTFVFPGCSFTVSKANCHAGILTVSASEGKPKPQSECVRYKISFGILEDAEVLVVLDVDVPDGTVPEVQILDKWTWKDAEIAWYTPECVAFHTSFDGEVYVFLRAPTGEAEA